MRLDSIPLSEVDTATGECAKPNCCTGSDTLHRHHRRHEAMWLGVWASRRKGESKYEKLIERYHDFNPDDWTRICDWHHAEIHLIYDSIILRDKVRTGRRLSEYSWKQAEKLMDKLEAACFNWLKTDSPGSSPKDLTRMRNNRRPKAPQRRAVR